MEQNKAATKMNQYMENRFILTTAGRDVSKESTIAGEQLGCARPVEASTSSCLAKAVS